MIGGRIFERRPAGRARDDRDRRPHDRRADRRRRASFCGCSRCRLARSTAQAITRRSRLLRTSDVAIEQFDAQSADHVVFGFGDGWNEAEFSEAAGLWRWTSDRAVLRVHAAGRSLTLTLRGEPPIVSHWRPAHVRISAGGRVVAEETLFTSFDLQVRIPAALVGGRRGGRSRSRPIARTCRRKASGASPDQRRLGFGCSSASCDQAGRGAVIAGFSRPRGPQPCTGHELKQASDPAIVVLPDRAASCRSDCRTARSHRLSSEQRGAQHRIDRRGRHA